MLYNCGFYFKSLSIEIQFTIYDVGIPVHFCFSFDNAELNYNKYSHNKYIWSTRMLTSVPFKWRFVTIRVDNRIHWNIVAIIYIKIHKSTYSYVCIFFILILNLIFMNKNETTNIQICLYVSIKNNNVPILYLLSISALAFTFHLLFSELR